MEYQRDVWDNYTVDNEFVKTGDVSKFIYYISLALGAKNILEVGCNVGNNFRDFPKNFDVHGIDLNEKALEKAKVKHPTFQFKRGSIIEIPFKDSTFDLVFTSGVLIHIHHEDMEKALIELFRVSRKWIFNIEYFGENEEEIKWKRAEHLLWYRNMKKRWSKSNVRIISDVDLPTSIEPNSKFTLVEKLL